MDVKLKTGQKTTFGMKFLSLMLSVMLMLSVTFCAGAPVVAVSTANPFYNGQQIFLDATNVSSWWTSQNGTTYYPYMYLFDDNVTPHVKCWVRMTQVENTEGLVLTGNVPDDGTRYCGLIFTRQSEDSADWNNRTHQTVDIAWDGTSNCYKMDNTAYSSYKYNMSGTWTYFEEPVPLADGAYTISTEASGAVITAKVDGKTTGTADAGDDVTVTIELEDGYSLDTVTVTGKSKTQYEIIQTGSNTFMFQMPEEKVTVKADCIFDKSKAFTGNVLWVNTQPDVTDSAIGLVKWTNRTGGSGGTTGIYTLYLPSGADMSNLPVYCGTGSLTINGNNVEQGQTYSFTEGQTYTVNGYSMRVMQSDSASIYLQTPKSLTIGSVAGISNDDAAQAYKETTKQTNGQFMSVGKDGNIIDQPQVLAQIKGRGNSSWEASCRYFGKYAYNIKLDKKADVLNMGAVKAKSFCLLANNMDESLLRNVETYQAAAMAGLGFVPHYEVADVYNNGEYLGSYLITEKVDVGKSKLVQGETVEDYHNDPNATGNTMSSTYTFQGNTYSFQYVDTGAVDEGVDYTKKSYLLEFDLQGRAQKENCWFQTPQKQYIAVKAPEDLNEQEMRFIIDKWINAENAVYSGDFEAMDSLMDLSSFADVYLIQEFTKNLDSGATSYYVYYDGTQENTKWQATPIWDYDWALGGYKNAKEINSGVDSNNQPNVTSGWFAKYKKIVVNDVNQFGWNLQAMLCSNTQFWNDYVVTAWNSHIYSALSDVFTSRIDTDYQAHSKSFAMNETRYSFIASDLISSWGSVNTGSTPDEAYTYLKNWANDRLSWMHNKLQTSFSGVSLSADKTMIAVGDTVTLTAAPYPSYTQGLEYTFRGNGSVIQQTTDKTITVSPNVGTSSYQVSAGGYDSDVVVVKVLSKISSSKPSCTTDGNIEYYTDGIKYYTLKKGAFTEISLEDTVIPATGHSYSEPEWYWWNTHYQARAEFICSNCGEKVREPAEVTYKIKDEGWLYTAKVTFEQKEYYKTYDTNRGEAYNRLSETNRVLYDKLLEHAENIVNGTETSSVCTITADHFPLEWTAAAFGLPDDTDFDTLAGEVSKVIDNLFPYKNKQDMKAVVNALLADCPYEFYWFDKTKGYSFEQSGYRIGGSSLNGVWTITVTPQPTFTVKMTVSANYRNGSEYEINSQAVNYVKNTVPVAAQNIVDKYAELPDYLKLKGYAEELCNLTDYNHDAANASDSSAKDPDAWQLVYVFDGNDATKVVCEGYSKAFQYLCSLTEFNSDDVISYLVTGTLGGSDGSGPHMWNVVSMEGGLNFLVDVTNSDSANRYPYTFLLKGGNAVQDESGYPGYRIVNTENQSDVLYFFYDDDTMNLWGNSILAIHSHDYSEYISIVSFDSAGGTKVTPQTVIKNDRAVRPAEPIKEGFDFAGWYLDDTEYDFSATVTNDITLTAHWNEKITYTPVLAVEATCTENGNILYYTGSDGKYYTLTDGVYTEISEEDTVIPTTGHKHGEAVIENEIAATYTTTGSYDLVVYCPVCGAEVSRETFVVPMLEKTEVVINSVDINGITTKTTVYAETFTAEDFIVPAKPYLDGYTFKGWTVNGSLYTNADDVKNAVAGLVAGKTTESVEVRVVYEQNEITHKVTVPTGAFSDDSTEKTFHVSELVTVIADKQSEEQQFAYWQRTNGQIVSYDKVYSFFMPDEDIELLAVYKDGVEEKGIAFIEKVDIDSAKGKFVFVSVCNVPESCTMQNAGIIADTDKSNVLSYNTASFQRLSTKATENTKNLKYTWTVNGANSDTVLYVRSYVSYKDSNGNVHEMLGDIIEAKLSGWTIVSEVTNG